MKRLWTLLFALAVLALTAGVLWWLLGRSTWRPPAPMRPSIPEVAPLPVVSGAQGTNARLKPLFWSSRSPVEVSEAAPNPDVAISEMSQMRLMAVIESGGQRVALLQRPDRSILKIDSALPEGEWRLESFDGAVAILVSAGGERVERPLDQAPKPTGGLPAPGRPIGRGGADVPNTGPVGKRPTSSGPALPSVTPTPRSGGLHPVKPMSTPSRPPSPTSPSGEPIGASVRT